VVPASSALLCFYCYCYPRDLHSFPTRRSSDLSRHYADVRQVYQTALANGGAASGPFIPELDNHPADPQAEQARLLQAWQKSGARSEEHTSELQSRENLVCRLLLEKKNKNRNKT